MPNLSKQRQSPALVALGQTIKRLRLERNGMSQEALSHKAEIDLSYVGRVERGDNNVSFLALQKIATALDITLTELMAEAEL